MSQQDENHAADHEHAADQLAQGRLLVQHVSAGDEGEDQFDLPQRSEEQAIKGATGSAPTYRGLAGKGLIRKDYLNGATGTGGVYLWESRAAAEAWFTPARIDELTQRFGARPRLTWYNASKGWVITATRSMAVELAPLGIRVVALCPVAGETPLLPTFMGGDTPELRAKFLSTIPLGRFSTPEDLGNAACFLCSDEASMITGVAMEIDGGRCI